MLKKYIRRNLPMNTSKQELRGTMITAIQLDGTPKVYSFLKPMANLVQEECIQFTSLTGKVWVAYDGDYILFAHSKPCKVITKEAFEESYIEAALDI